MMCTRLSARVHLIARALKQQRSQNPKLRLAPMLLLPVAAGGDVWAGGWRHTKNVHVVLAFQFFLCSQNLFLNALNQRHVDILELQLSPKVA
jgi:hypothetical protein